MAVFAAGWLVACGGNSLPAGDAQDPTPGGGLPGEPVNPGGPGGQGNGEEPTGTQTLWPLTTGSTWVYDIQDPVEGNFQKQVTVVGPGEVPGQPGINAVQVHSRQDRVLNNVLYEEYSWQVELTNGLVVRLREDDHRDGQQVRSTTWSPATVKSVARVPDALPWTYKSDVLEHIILGDGSRDEKSPTYIWKVLETGVTVTTKAGTFTNAVKIQRDKVNDNGEVKQDKTRFYWLVPGIGKVREEGERTEDLASYDIKP
ncbi:putative lipoprotein [Corallococcus macrosporus]|uniref:Putative lipoprotein n=1 Tax=Myxococcus fulvus (strain ATCC BAA-855 / HW-1) TaxID=483219 RepID=F8CD99_MYXFH|nr:putative lipoprotein [Corallococcus macrosporus]